MNPLYYELTDLTGTRVNQADFDPVITPVTGMTPPPDANGVITLRVQTVVNEDASPVEPPLEEVIANFYDEQGGTLLTSTVFSIVEEYTDIKVALLTMQPPVIQEGSEGLAVVNAINEIEPGDTVYYEITGPGIDANDFEMSFNMTGTITIDNQGQGTLLIPTVVNSDEFAGNNNPVGENLIMTIYCDDTKEEELSTALLTIAENLVICTTFSIETANTSQNVIMEGEEAFVPFQAFNVPDDITTVEYEITGEGIDADDFAPGFQLSGSLPLQRTGVGSVRAFLNIPTVINDDTGVGIFENAFVTFILDGNACTTNVVTILDDTPAAAKALLFDSPSVVEGNSVEATFISPATPDNTVVHYRIFGSSGSTINEDDFEQSFDLIGTMTVVDGEATLTIPTVNNEDDVEPTPEFAIMEVYEDAEFETLCATNGFTIVEEEYRDTMIASFIPQVVIEGDPSTLVVSGITTNPGDTIFFEMTVGDSPLADENDYDYDGTDPSVTKNSRTSGSFILDANNEAEIDFETFINADDAPTENLIVNFFNDPSLEAENYLTSATLTISDDPRAFVQAYAIVVTNPVANEGETINVAVNGFNITDPTNVILSVTSASFESGEVTFDNPHNGDDTQTLITLLPGNISTVPVNINTFVNDDTPEISPVEPFLLTLVVEDEPDTPVATNTFTLVEDFLEPTGVLTFDQPVVVEGNPQQANLSALPTATFEPNQTVYYRMTIAQNDIEDFPNTPNSQTQFDPNGNDDLDIPLEGQFDFDADGVIAVLPFNVLINDDNYAYLIDDRFIPGETVTMEVYADPSFSPESFIAVNSFYIEESNREVIIAIPQNALITEGDDAIIEVFGANVPNNTVFEWYQVQFEHEQVVTQSDLNYDQQVTVFGTKPDYSNPSGSFTMLETAPGVTRANFTLRSIVDNDQAEVTYTDTNTGGTVTVPVPTPPIEPTLFYILEDSDANSEARISYQDGNNELFTSDDFGTYDVSTTFVVNIREEIDTPNAGAVVAVPPIITENICVNEAESGDVGFTADPSVQNKTTIEFRYVAEENPNNPSTIEHYYRLSGPDLTTDDVDVPLEGPITLALASNATSTLYRGILEVTAQPNEGDSTPEGSPVELVTVEYAEEPTFDPETILGVTAFSIVEDLKGHTVDVTPVIQEGNIAYMRILANIEQVTAECGGNPALKAEVLDTTVDEYYYELTGIDVQQEDFDIPLIGQLGDLNKKTGITSGGNPTNPNNLNEGYELPTLVNDDGTPSPVEQFFISVYEDANLNRLFAIGQFLVYEGNIVPYVSFATSPVVLEGQDTDIIVFPITTPPTPPTP